MTDNTGNTGLATTPAHTLIEKTFGLEYFTTEPKIIEQTVKPKISKKKKGKVAPDSPAQVTLEEKTSTEVASPAAQTTKSESIPIFGQNNAKRLVIAVLRETIAPFIDRSEDPEETISIRVNEREIIEVPARKMKSKEKLAGLRLCRAYGVVDASYEYNAVKTQAEMANPNSVLFGDSVVEQSETAMLPSRVKYSSSYSIRERVKLTTKLTHNALSEQGTMWNRVDKKFRQSLFSTEYILPGTLFPSFIVIDDPTPESLVHILMCLRETRYGAQTSITGPNIKNTIVAILGCQNEPPVTSYTITKNHPELQESKDLRADVIKTIIQDLSGTNGKLLSGKPLEDFLVEANKLDGNSMKAIYAKLKNDAVELCKYAGLDK
ncbi:MAG: type I-D CRISPR-associated protein Cas7/Csc2 [Candidatus Methanoperedens sp.]|nr:type I-D CRISPR-associated protein Cas7/Csc2 [Candidatus Methanoperedens sp.]